MKFSSNGEQSNYNLAWKNFAQSLFLLSVCSFGIGVDAFHLQGFQRYSNDANRGQEDAMAFRSLRKGLQRLGKNKLMQRIKYDLRENIKQAGNQPRLKRTPRATIVTGFPNRDHQRLSLRLSLNDNLNVLRDKLILEIGRRKQIEMKSKIAESQFILDSIG